MSTQLQSWQIGDVKVTKILENAVPIPIDGLIANVDAERLASHEDWLKPHFVTPDGQMILSIHALVVESAGQTIVVDTCMGNDRPLPQGMGELQTDFLEQLERVVKREQVDVVLCTHLHFDHVGWNTMKEGDAFVPTFPNARYLFARPEFEHWNGVTDDVNYEQQYSIDPVVEAGLHELVEMDHVITDELRFEPTPGHTPGHVSVVIESAGERAVITGDMVHHPVQLAEPGWGSHPDVTPERATRTRQEFVARYGDADVLVIGTHFAGPTAGHIKKVGASCRFEVE